MATAKVQTAGIRLVLDLTFEEAAALKGMVQNAINYHQHPSDESPVDREIRRAIWDSLIELQGR